MEGFKPFGWYLTLVQFGFYSMFGLVELQLTQDKRRRYDNRLCFAPQKTAFTVKHILCLTFSSLFFFFFFLNFISSRIPGKTYMIIAFLTVGTMGLSNTSLGYLNYPTQVIFKCCKLIPVMIGGVFIQGQLPMLILIYSVRIVCIFGSCSAKSSSLLLDDPQASVLQLSVDHFYAFLIVK